MGACATSSRDHGCQLKSEAVGGIRAVHRSHSHSKNQTHIALVSERMAAAQCDWHVCPHASVRAAGGVSASSAFLILNAKDTR